MAYEPQYMGCTTRIPKEPDPFGLSWQIAPRRFTELIRDRDPGKVKAVMEAMMTMVKLDVAELERAYNEA